MSELFREEIPLRWRIWRAIKSYVPEAEHGIILGILLGAALGIVAAINS